MSYLAPPRSGLKKKKKKRTLALPSLVHLFRAIWISSETRLVIETFCFAARVVGFLSVCFSCSRLVLMILWLYFRQDFYVN